MRILFNHGLTAEELYTNTPTTITDKHWRWFIKHYGSSSSYSDALSDPFKYCLYLMLNKVIDQKIRFKIPSVAEAYIDFEAVTGENFELQRQNGRFQNIDFINSDFTGYVLKYYYKAKAYQKSYQIYLGSELKNKFLEKINSGEKFYTVKDIELKDFIDEVYIKFPELSKLEVKKLLNHGFRRMHSAIKIGCAITINTTKYGNCYIYIGNLTLNPQRQIKAYSIRRDKKLRRIASWNRTKFDGFYYIAINKTLFKTWFEDNKKSRKILIFKNVIPRKIQQELYYKFKEAHIFKIKIKQFKGWSFWCEELKTRDVEYIGETNNLSFIPKNRTWKELIKMYETEYNK